MIQGNDCYEFDRHFRQKENKRTYFMVTCETIQMLLQHTCKF